MRKKSKYDREKILEQYQHIPIPAGAALFWDQRLPHANSFKNNSNKTRRCIYGGFLPHVDKNTLYAKEQLQRFEKGLPQVDFWMKEQEGRLFQETIIEKEQINDLGLKMLGAVLLKLVFIVGFAPSFNNIFTTSTSLPALAIINGVCSA